jgi:hypothetical protein
MAIQVPICKCGKRATAYHKIYTMRHVGHDIPIADELGFRCKKCGTIRIPWMQEFDMTYMNSMLQTRLSGIAFDNSIGLIYDN